MQQRLSLLTLAAEDLSKVRAFYEETLGWRPEAVNEAIVFYRLNGFLLAFFGKKALAEDARVGEGGEARAFGGFTLAHNLATEAEVDALFRELEAKGVKVTKPPEKTFFGGYSGYFEDVEGNLWEVATNPYVTLDAEGNVTGHADISKL